MQIQLDFPLNTTAQIDLPRSKSISNRALLITALTPAGKSPLQIARCDDTEVTLAALNSVTQHIDIKAAGTAMRFLTAYYAVTPGTKTITGTERMQNRPIKILVDALKELGADITYLKKEGFPPLKIEGKPLSGGELVLDGTVSSQFITALLLIAPTLKRGLTLKLKSEPISKPYINMTLALMNKYGANAHWLDQTSIHVAPKGYKALELEVEPDWSAASYWFEIVALNPIAQIVLPNLSLASLQGDAKGVELFKKLGVSCKERNGCITLSKSNEVCNYIDADLKDIPDLAQTLIVTATLLGVPFKFRGLQTLRIKETDRIDALIKELKKLGYLLKAEGDHTISWEGRLIKEEEAPTIETYDDHRMALAFAPAAILHPDLTINHPEVVTKSYPEYWEDLQKAGVKLLKK